MSKKEKMKLSESLESMDRADERTALAVVLLLLGSLNGAVMTLAPAYVVYRRILDNVPQVTEAQLNGYLMPIICLSIVTGIAVFYVTVTIYVRLYNGMTNSLDSSRYIP